MGAVIGNIIVAVLALIGGIYGSYKASDKTQALLEYRLKELEAKQDKHNRVIERTFQLEEDVALLRAEDKRTNERLKVLEAKP